MKGLVGGPALLVGGLGPGPPPYLLNPALDYGVIWYDTTVQYAINIYFV